MKNRFKEVVPKIGLEDAENYRQQYFKQQVMQHCPQLSFISQPGRSDLVCSSDISVGDALRKANELSKTLRDVQCNIYAPLISARTNLLSTLIDEQIVHRAVGMLTLEMLDGMYYFLDEMNLETMYNFVDPLL